MENGIHVPEKVRNTITAAAAVGFLFDAYTINIFGLTLSLIATDFGENFKMMGLIGSMFIAGYTVGSFLFGMLADRLGRKLSLGLSIAGYGIITAITGFSQNIFQFGIGRFFSGLGGGGELTVGVPYVVEAWPTGKRTLGTGIMLSGYALGLILTALIAKLLLPLYGWRSLYFFSVVPATLIFLFRMKLEESPRYLQVRESISSGKAKHIGFLEFMKDKNSMVRLMWGTFIYVSITSIYYAQAFYEVTMMEKKFHLPLSGATNVILLFNAGMFVSSLLGSGLAERIGRKAGGVLALLVMAGSVWGAYSTQSVTMYIIMGTITFSMIGTSWTIGMAHVAELFPTQIRGSAYGWCVALGRVPSIFAPLIIAYVSSVVPGGISAAMQWSFVILLFALLAYVFGPETHGKEIDDLATDPIAPGEGGHSTTALAD